MKKIFVIGLCAIFLMHTMMPVSADSAISVSAQHAVLYKPETKTFLYEKSSDARAPMASTTKIMTALIAIERSNPDLIVTIPPEACGIEGSSIYMSPGEHLTMRELLYALLLQSANDAATAIALAVSGSIEAFSDEMNARAYSLGLNNTHFTNPHGLDDVDHYTSARDLALITACAMENEFFKEIVSTKKYTISDGKDSGVRVLVNHNKLLRMYDGAVGVKTGFTKRSGRCLVGACEKNGLTFITVTINAPNDWNDHIRMFDYGYEHFKSICLYRSGEFIYEIPTIFGDHSSILCTNSEDIHATLSSNDDMPDMELDLPHFLFKKYKRGRVIGSIRFRKNGKIVAESPMIIK